MSNMLTKQEADNIFDGIMNRNYETWRLDGINRYYKSVNDRCKILIDNDVCSIYDEYERVWRYVQCAEFQCVNNHTYLILECGQVKYLIPFKEDVQ